MEKQTYPLGSEWRKWDLHIHTKNTNKNDQFTSTTFDDFCVEMFRKAIDNEIAVIGITDYFSIDNYNEVRNFLNSLDSNELFLDSEKEKIKQIMLIPNVELRMLPSTSSGRLINIHCLFNPNYISKLDNDFFGAIEFSHGSRKYRMNKDDFVNLGKAMGEKENELAHKKGIDNFVVSHSELQKILAENAEFKNNTIIVTNNKSTDGASGVQKHFDLFEDEQNSSLDATRQAIYKLTDMIFSSNKSDIDYFLGLKKDSKEEVIKKCGSLKPCIHGSDAHSEDKLFNPDSNRYCWIKANPTFEGLKQVIYEPSRVHIGENKPQSALHKLDDIELNFDNTFKWGDDKFCFAGFNDKLRLSPYLTCVIGGRGSGKSTLLNLIAKKIDKENKDFFNDLIPKGDIKSKVIFTPEEIGNIEFLAQNTIEDFAKDAKKFTQAIFERIDKKSDGKLVSLENEVENELSIYDKQIDLLQRRQQLRMDFKEKKKELKKNENIVKTLSSPELITNNKELSKLQKEKIELEKSRAKYKELYSKIEEIQDRYLKIDESKNSYENYYNELGDELKGLFEKFKAKDCSPAIEELKSIDDQMKQYSEKIRDYLASRGMSEDNIKDAQFATENIETIKSDKAIIIQSLCEIKQKLKSFSNLSIDNKISDFKKDVDNQLNTINTNFKKISDENPNEIKPIKVIYELNSNIFDAVFDDAVERLDISGRISSFRATFKDYVKEVALDEVLQFKHSSEFIEKISPRTTQAYNALIDIFGKSHNFKIYQSVIQKHQRDIKHNKLFRVYYDDKILDNSSFGQRCTAAIVVLLSLGNNPIIIDEPEAHLDSSLIANYLVELIKQQKQQRQIIFATHNANFVLNADAELIIKLENSEGLTKSTLFSIEDLEYREDLLKLEGGREAFKKRERKYNIN